MIKKRQQYNLMIGIEDMYLLESTKGNFPDNRIHLNNLLRY